VWNRWGGPFSSDSRPRGPVERVRRRRRRTN